jgi:SAM-dependent methyltransferase
MNRMEAAYGRRMAEVYDLVYTAGRHKDYAAEAAELSALVRDRDPDAQSLLDVACGTGEHLRHLRSQFSEVAGVELSDPMRERAVAKLPDVPVYAGDMRDFDLGRTFDVVACLFSAVGYTRSVAELRAAARAMAAHVAPGGLLVLDPWFYPGTWEGGQLDHTVAVGDGLTVLRLAASTRTGRTSRVEYHYLVGDAHGVSRFTDVHEMTLYTPDEYAAAIRAAGLRYVDFIEGWTPGRARIVATAKRR